jgi:hypothetical protein
VATATYHQESGECQEITGVKFSRVWAMPNKWTFQIKPIKELLNRYVLNGQGWIDPFAEQSQIAQYTNDFNPAMPSGNHQDAIEFVHSFTCEFEGALIDPPYSLRQIKECYDGLGKELPFEKTQTQFTDVKNVLAKKIKLGGYAICFGWNTNGFGINRGFELIEVLLVPHGGHHNDTIVTVERRVR